MSCGASKVCASGAVATAVAQRKSRDLYGGLCIHPGDRVVEDVKSDATRREREYVLKRKLFEARFCRNGDAIFFENVGGNGRLCGMTASAK